ncbi:hypothetical protein FB567DRAFT_528155 [Paraphoma chrysanthemicola]|uniref:Uncharacterized protein n=1 Tax=Paraphoma chrysanthemicola TaxID=798071 RepID=A0A8K0R4R0_9PLEO|nr:hypothetical protein FB567DRAFT_528155 [Paraphoma chrysanthemicola]
MLIWLFQLFPNARRIQTNAQDHPRSGLSSYALFHARMKQFRERENVHQIENPFRDSDHRSVSLDGSKVSRTYGLRIPGILYNTQFVDALGDTGSKCNVIDEDFAKEVGLHVDRTITTSVMIGSGRIIRTSGMAETTFRFREEQTSYTLQFRVMKNCIHDVILGKQFLKATKTFTCVANRARRVIKRAYHTIKDSINLLYLGDSAPKFTGLLNGRPVEALADTGARALIMDEDYARSIGLFILNGVPYRSKLRFADGSTAWTSGMTYGVKWEFGLGGKTAPLTLDFHILKSAPARVILSEDLLLNDTNAFVEYDCYLLDEDEDEPEDGYILAIDITTKHDFGGQTAVTGVAQHVQDVQWGTELDRRLEEATRIARLTSPQKQFAQAQEDQRRAQWDANPPVTLVAPPSTIPEVQHVTSPDKRRRWRFWLKPKNHG